MVLQKLINYLRRIFDVGDTASNNADVPVRFLPALIAGLAFHIAMKKPELADRAVMLRDYYIEQFDLAAQEDSCLLYTSPSPRDS